MSEDKKELNENDLDKVNGGAYSLDEFDAAERLAAERAAKADAATTTLK